MEARVARASAAIAEQRQALGAVTLTASRVEGREPDSGARADSDAESDAEVATAPRTEMRADENAGAAFDDDGPAWPSEATEAAYLGEAKESGDAVPRAGVQTLRQAAEAEEAALGPLPALDVLISRIPAEARETLDDLFRVKFTGVRRVPKHLLKQKGL